jgi:hypothetical protein
VHRNRFILNNQPDALIIPILFCYKILSVSGIFSAHHQEFSTVHSALVSIMQVSDDRFQAESGWNCKRLIDYLKRIQRHILPVHHSNITKLITMKKSVHICKQ